MGTPMQYPEGGHAFRAGVAHGLAYKRRDHVADDVVHAHVAADRTEDAPVAEVEGDALLVEEFSERLAGAKVENVGRLMPR
ncbi:MAG: hypothetical protein IPI33_09315 [Dehalococcoidia bacterium]|nr:hypothetical protein [Dehalococcoidia bacterium]